jgi:eukaryotic-like serine/threonine-protein kinase
VNVLIGQQLMFLATRPTSPGSQNQAVDAFKSHRKWLLSKLSSDLIQSQEHYAYASTLARYAIAIYRAHYSQLSSEATLDYLHEAVQWSKWLADKRGQSTDQALSEAAQRELAAKLESDALTDQAAGAWQRLANDLELWTNVDEPRPDRLQALAYARMRFAHLSATLLRSDVAIDSYQRAIDDLSHAWNLLDADSFYRTNLATAQHNLGKLIATHSSQSGEAAHWLGQSITNYQTLLKSEVTPDTIRRLCEANGSLAELLSRDQREDALKHFNDAAMGYQMLADHQLIREDDRIHWCEILIARATHHHSLQNGELANQDMAAATKQLEELNPESLSATQLARLNRTKALLPTNLPTLSEVP